MLLKITNSSESGSDGCRGVVSLHKLTHVREMYRDRTWNDDGDGDVKCYCIVTLHICICSVQFSHPAVKTAVVLSSRRKHFMADVREQRLSSFPV